VLSKEDLMASLDVIFGFVLVLGVLILVHEWGHFIVARLFGVRVDVFSIGFGPRLFGFKWGATDWRISAVPLGGYVRMAGQDITEIDSGDTKPTGAPDELMSKPRWQRALISFAGPLVNLIFPLFLLTGYFVMKGEPYPAFQDKPLVFTGAAKDSPLTQAGAVRGDRIISLNGTENPTWGSLETVLSKPGADGAFHLLVDHQGTPLNVNFTLTPNQEVSSAFGYPPISAVVKEVAKGFPAKQAGIKRDDVIEAVNGNHVDSWPNMTEFIQHNQGNPLQLTVRRNGQLMNFTLTPQKSKNERGEDAWMIGISNGPESYYRKVSFSQAVTIAARDTWRGAGQIVQIVGKLVTGKYAVKQLQSVIGIASMAGQAVQEGSSAVLLLMVSLSLNLGILNLLPIPILDGGNILLLTMEGIRRRDFSLTFKERYIQVGLVFLLVFFVYVMYNDVVRLLPTHS
jgi:regulator of sigma E protease